MEENLFGEMLQILTSEELADLIDRTNSAWLAQVLQDEIDDRKMATEYPRKATKDRTDALRKGWGVE